MNYEPRSLLESIKANYDLLGKEAAAAEKDRPDMLHMKQRDAFQIVADRIGFDFKRSPTDPISDTLDCAEEFLRNKQQ